MSHIDDALGRLDVDSMLEVWRELRSKGVFSTNAMVTGLGADYDEERRQILADTFTEADMRRRGQDVIQSDDGLWLELSHSDLPYFTRLPFILRESARFEWQGRPQALLVKVAFPDETADALQVLYPGDQRARAIAQLIHQGGGSFVYSPRPKYLRVAQQTGSIPWQTEDLADPMSDLVAQVNGTYFDVIRNENDDTWSAMHDHRYVQRGLPTREQAMQVLETLASGDRGHLGTALTRLATDRLFEVRTLDRPMKCADCYRNMQPGEQAEFYLQYGTATCAECTKKFDDLIDNAISMPAPGVKPGSDRGGV